tara:strand:+ start:6885 stop:7382 length:498 start_codon:yes stop_codon:yes gene_type:complete
MSVSIDQNLGAQNYFKVIEKIRDILLANPNINTVTNGDIGDVDLDKQTIFPLAHIIVGNATFEGGTINYKISVLIMDVVHDDLDDEKEPSLYQGSTELYVHNTTLNIGNHLTDKLFKGDKYDGNFYVNKETATAIPFRDRFENTLAGWTFEFNIIVRNNIDRCNS